MTSWPVAVDPIFGCWLWQRALDRDGYGVSWRGRVATRAHVAVYRDLVGEIPVAMVLDHICRRRNCVAPAHLEPVTQQENEFRKSWKYRARRSRCKNDHDLRVAAIVTPEGGRVCRLCR